MNSLREAVAFLLAVICILVHSSPLSARDDALKDYFLKNAPTRWKEFEERMRTSSIICVMKHRLTDASSGKEQYHSETNIKQKNGSQFLYQLVSSSPQMVGSKVHAINESYYFHLTLPKGSWLLSDLRIKERDPKSVGTLDEDARPELKCTRVLCSGLYCYSQYLPDLVKEKGFRVIGASKSETDPRAVVIEFETSDLRTNRNNITGGKITLLPDEYWTIRSFDVNNTLLAPTLHYSLRGEKSNEHVGSGGLPFPRTSLVRVIPMKGSPGGTLEYRNEYQCQPLSPHDDEFRLKAFGLPEPILGDANEAKSVPWFIWFAAIGFVCIASAVLVQWRGGKTASLVRD